MDREKQIEEMARAMCFQSEHCSVDSCVRVNCEKTWLAEKLYNAGYSKQSDVIDELVGELKDFLDDTYSTGEDALIEIHDLIDYIAQKMKGGADG